MDASTPIYLPTGSESHGLYHSNQQYLLPFVQYFISQVNVHTYPIQQGIMCQCRHKDIDLPPPWYFFINIRHRQRTTHDAASGT